MSKRLSKRLKCVRNCLNLTQKNFSDFLEVPYNTYQKWEENKNAPALEQLEIIADKLGVSIDWLLGRDNFFVVFGRNKGEILKKIVKK